MTTIIVAAAHLVAYRKVGGLHFMHIGRFGFSFYISRK